MEVVPKAPPSADLGGGSQEPGKEVAAKDDLGCESIMNDNLERDDIDLIAGAATDGSVAVRLEATKSGIVGIVNGRCKARWACRPISNMEIRAETL